MMFRILKNSPMILAAGLMLMAGCSSVNTIERANSRAQPSTIQTRKIITDGSLSWNIKVVGLNETTLPDGSLKIQASLRNTQQRIIRINYRFEWFDHAGMIINSSSQSWKPATAMGGETLSITAVAPHPSAVDFRLKLREAKR